MAIHLCYIALFSLCSTLAFAATIHVPADQRTIQAGIDISQNGDVVLVDAGIYKGEGNVNLDFKGKQITVKSCNGPETTIIDCEEKLETRGFHFQNSETAASVLDGFTVKDVIHKGAIFCFYSSPTIKNCVISRNHSAGILCLNSSPIITDCTISHNLGAGISITTPDNHDGVLWAETRSKPTITNCTVKNNIGIGISCLDASAIIKDCVISKNGKRGVFCDFFSGAVLTNCHITENADGGLKCLEYSRITVENSIIDKNTAEDGGGIFCSATSSLYATDCVIANNTAVKNGGGVWDLTRFGDAYIRHCTITQNAAGNRGGGIYVDDRGDLNMTHSIVWNNTSDGTHAEVFAWGFVTIESCNIKNGLMGIDPDAKQKFLVYVDNIDEDPLFVNADAGNFTLQPNSPAEGMGVRGETAGQEEVEQEVSVSHRGKQLVRWADLKRR